MQPLGVIPTYLSKDFDLEVLKVCVDTFYKSCDAKLLVCDDASPNEELKNELVVWLGKNHPKTDVILSEENKGFATNVNIGLQKALEDGSDAVLINADIEFREIGWLDEMLRTEADIVGALLYYPSLIIQHAGIYFSPITRSFDHRFRGAPPNLPAAQNQRDCPVTGALQLIRHKVLDDIGLYDEDFFMGYEDVDYCLRAIEKGYKSTYNPKVKAVHYESLFRGEILKDEQKESYNTLIRKHADTNFHGIVPTMMEPDGI